MHLDLIWTRTLKIAGALFVILLLILISKLIASLIRRSIIQRADKEQRGTEATKVGNLVHDIVFYILVIFSFFV